MRKGLKDSTRENHVLQSDDGERERERERDREG